MSNDNATPLSASEFDKKVNDIIPFYSEFYNQVLDVIEQCQFRGKIDWLDMGCGTGTLQELAFQRLAGIDLNFVLVDIAEKMIEQAKEKLKDRPIEQYICASSDSIDFKNRFDIVTAVQTHHYLHEDERRRATEAAFRALKDNGIYIVYENVIPEDENVNKFELLRWGRYQQRRGRTKEEARAHNARCGVYTFPITVAQQIQLQKEAGFKTVQVFWYSYMTMGIYGLKDNFEFKFD